MHGVVQFALFVVLLAASPSEPQRNFGGEEHPSRKRVIAYAKSLDVKQLDPSLSSERLDRFLARSLAGVSLRWVSSDCENKPPTFPRPPDTPLCASVFGSLHGRGLRLHIVVGTHARPVSGTPHLEKLYLLGSPKRGRDTVVLSSLSELPRVVK
jgi:hypothetical protein